MFQIEPTPGFPAGFFEPPLLPYSSRRLQQGVLPVVKMKFVSLYNPTNFVSVVIMAFSLFGFVGNVMTDFNWGNNPVVASIAFAYWLTLRRMIPFPLNYWGVGALAYFALFLVSFGILNRTTSFCENILETARLASVVLILFEMGVLTFVPNFMNNWVLAAFAGTFLAWFTNWDLLGTGILVLLVSEYFILNERRV